MGTQGPESQGDDDRREFLKSCGRLAATVPPAMTILLSTSLSSEAIAASTGGGGGKGGKGGKLADRGPKDGREGKSPPDARFTHVDVKGGGLDIAHDKFKDRQPKGG